MQNKIGFWTPICHEGQKTKLQYLQEGIERYFYLGGKVAYVIQGKEKNAQEVQLKDEKQHLLVTALKIASYFTVTLCLFTRARDKFS